MNTQPQIIYVLVEVEKDTKVKSLVNSSFDYTLLAEERDALNADEVLKMAYHYTIQQVPFNIPMI